MPPRRPSVNARRFLAAHIHSVVQLDLLLLLHRDRALAWTASDAARELRAPEPWIAGQLADLCAAGVAAAGPEDPPAFRFAARDALGEVVLELADLHARRRTTLVRLIHAARDDVQSFSDAFRLRRDED
jgi:hypothetical protein